MTDIIYTSDWGGLSKHLIASFYEVDRDGKRKKHANIVVKAPIADDANLEVTLNWQSPFEQAGPESSFPSFAALLQSGSTQAVESVLDVFFSKSIADDVKPYLKKFEGRTGITKLNSTQVFTGMPPVKLSLNLLFRAWKDPATEVQQPFNQLMSWALPKSLAKDSVLAGALTGLMKGSKDWIEAVLPSESPTLLGMTYKNNRYAPLVIESIQQPISSPVDADGQFVELMVPVSLATLTAIDRNDWATFNIKR
ncbi:hypothetical protein [Methylomonas sp. HYX-M1]|uniref:hypothetical protein n=1 Tax=Methylomonas sp. HYX-M1 TaxID=3139307 RepID=UPI00345BE99E